MGMRVLHFACLSVGTAAMVAVLPATASGASTPGRYTTIDVPGAVSTTPAGINDLGVIVGNYTDSSGNLYSYVDRDGKFVTIDDPSAPPFSTVAISINDSGVIGGAYYDTNGVPHGFIDRDGKFTTIDDPAGVDGTIAEINNVGLIFGLYYDASGEVHGFTDRNSNFTTIDAPQGVDGTFISWINDFGVIAGTYNDSSGNPVSYVDQGGTYTTISDPNAPPFSTFNSFINDFGVVVGAYVDAGGVDHGFTELDGRYTSVDDPSAATESDAPYPQGTAAVAINNLGVIVGFYFDSSGNAHGLAANPEFVEHGDDVPRLPLVLAHEDYCRILCGGGSPGRCLHCPQWRQRNCPRSHHPGQEFPSALVHGHNSTPVMS